jgi:hypothetical protein
VSVVPEIMTGCLRRLMLKFVMGWSRMEEVLELATVEVAVVTEVLEVVAEMLEMFIELLVATGVVDASTEEAKLSQRCLAC